MIRQNLLSSPSWNAEQMGFQLARQATPVAGLQSGAALVTGLIFLVILTLLGVTAMQTSTMEERMSGNARDRNIALQAAEAALRDAERDILCREIDGTIASTQRTFGCISGKTGADATCTDGLCCIINAPGIACVERPAGHPVYTDFSLSAAPSVAYGTYSAAPALPSVSQQPRYLIEPYRKQEVNYYRITARGYGANANTQVTLQEVYKE
ncbi:MAG: pilus assembly protein [Sulfuricella sp.]|jgi:type IV pilus assembly protein PilX